MSMQNQGVHVDYIAPQRRRMFGSMPNIPHKKLAGSVFMFMIAVAVPLTLYVNQQQQNIRQNAQEPTALSCVLLTNKERVYQCQNVSGGCQSGWSDAFINVDCAKGEKCCFRNLDVSPTPVTQSAPVVSTGPVVTQAAQVSQCEKQGGTCISAGGGCRQIDSASCQNSSNPQGICCLNQNVSTPETTAALPSPTPKKPLTH
jgi:hypothetical protein